MSENPALITLDHTGLGRAPMEPGNDEQAEEWLGMMYEEGVRRMGRGATFDMIQFSQVSNRGLAGMGRNPPDPLHMAGFFGQLFHAGTKQDAVGANSSGGSSTLGSRGKEQHLHMPVPAEVLDAIIRNAEKEAPQGVKGEIIDKAARATAARPGASFRDKQVGGLRTLGKGKAKSASSQEGEQWGGDQDEEERKELGITFVSGRGDLTLTNDSEGWKKLIHYQCTRQFLPTTYARVALRGALPGELLRSRSEQFSR